MGACRAALSSIYVKQLTLFMCPQGILWRHMEQTVPNCTAIVAACAKLHNFCIEVCGLGDYSRARRRANDRQVDRRADRDQQGIPFPLLRSLVPRNFTHTEFGGSLGALEAGPRFLDDRRHQTVRRDKLARVLYHIRNGRRPPHASIRVR